MPHRFVGLVQGAQGIKLFCAVNLLASIIFSALLELIHSFSKLILIGVISNEVVWGVLLMTVNEISL